ncbi:hypothetical protein [Escherichia coli]|uniref:hypothetical protein n=1 Tax=Escherichia coli TaxID=562 RepID=UPI00208DFB0E|nr:hypothetical protein [Escherichia coli]
MLGGADNPNGELLSYIIGADTGEVGAASGPLMLAYLASVMSRTDGPGKKGLLHLSADNGQRAAAIVRERAWCAVGTKMQNGTFCM